MSHANGGFFIDITEGGFTTWVTGFAQAAAFVTFDPVGPSLTEMTGRLVAANGEPAPSVTFSAMLVGQ